MMSNKSGQQRRSSRSETLLLHSRKKERGLLEAVRDKKRTTKPAIVGGKEQPIGKQIVRVLGPVGIGKTTLIETVFRNHPGFVKGRFEEQPPGATTVQPYSALVQICEGLCQKFHDLLGEQQLRQYEQQQRSTHPQQQLLQLSQLHELSNYVNEDDLDLLRCFLPRIDKQLRPPEDPSTLTAERLSILNNNNNNDSSTTTTTPLAQVSRRNSFHRHHPDNAAYRQNVSNSTMTSATSSQNPSVGSGASGLRNSSTNSKKTTTANSVSTANNQNATVSIPRHQRRRLECRRQRLRDAFVNLVRFLCLYHYEYERQTTNDNIPAFMDDNSSNGSGKNTRNAVPICCFIDDIQYADSETLAVLQAIVDDPSIHGLILILAVRNGNDELMMGGHNSNKQTPPLGSDSSSSSSQTLPSSHPLVSSSPAVSSSSRQAMADRHNKVERTDLHLEPLQDVEALVGHECGLGQPERIVGRVQDAADVDDDANGTTTAQAPLGTTLDTDSGSSPSGLSAETQKLTDAVYSVSKGNPLHSIVLLQELRNHDLLPYHTRQGLEGDNVNDQQQEQHDQGWNAKGAIESLQNVNKNMDDSKTPLLVTVRQIMENLPEGTRTILKIASCLGTTLELSRLRAVTAMYVRNTPGDDLSQADDDHSQMQPPKQQQQRRRSSIDDNNGFLTELSEAQRQGLVVFDQDENQFSFRHDCFQQVAYSMVGGGVKASRDMIHFQIGLILRKVLDFTRSRSDVPLYLDQLNRGAYLIHDSHEVLEFAKINLIRAEELCQSSCFGLAAHHLKLAKDQLGGQLWTIEYYELSLQIVSLLMDAEYGLQNADASMAYVRELYLNTRKDSPEDLYRAKMVHLELLLARDKVAETLDVGHVVLSEMGEKATRGSTKLRGMTVLTSMKMKLQGMTNDDIAILPTMGQKNKLAVMEFLSFLAPVACIAKEEQLLPIYAGRMLELTFKYGICRHSAFALALFGFECANSFDFDMATRCGELALRMMDRFDHEDHRALILIQMLLDPLTRPLGSNMSEQRETILTAMDRGDFYAVGRGCTYFAVTAFFSARVSLDFLAKYLNGLLSQLKSHGRSGMYTAVAVIGRSVVEFMGHCTDRPALDDACQKVNELEIAEDDAGVKDDDTNSSTSTEVEKTLRCYQAMILSVYMNEDELALVRAEKAWSLTGLVGTYPCTSHYEFFSAIVALDAVSAGKNRKYQKVYNKMYKSLQRVANLGCPNVKHLLLMLDAEVLVSKKKPSVDVKAAYDKAIQAADEGGFQADVAFAYERAGAYFFRKRYGSNFSTYMTAAHSHYTSWGAHAKAKQLERAYELR